MSRATASITLCIALVAFTLNLTWRHPVSAQLGEMLISAPSTSELKSSLQLNVEKYTLKNGLTVLLHQDRSLPMIAVHQWFRVGSRHEEKGKTGLAHFFEHMMFKGTKKYPSGQYDELVKSHGGSNNAFTSNDYTGYYIVFPSQSLELALDLESDRMRNLMLDIKEIQSEREVVKEERRVRVDNSVTGFLFEKMFQTVYPKAHPYNWPVIGYMEDLNSASVDDLNSFYMAHYAPNNAVLVIVGDIDIKRTRRLVDRYYGSMKPQKIPRPVGSDQILGEAQNLVSPVENWTDKEVQSITSFSAYRAVPDGHPDGYALDTLAKILSGGTSSRFYQKLIKGRELAVSVNAFSYAQGIDGLFVITSALRPQTAHRAYESALRQEIARVQRELVSERELLTAKNMIMADFVQSIKTFQGKAYLLASMEVVRGDYEKFLHDFEHYGKVTRDDIRRVAKMYLRDDRKILVGVKPKSPQKVGAL